MYICLFVVIVLVVYLFFCGGNSFCVCVALFPFTLADYAAAITYSVRNSTSVSSTTAPPSVPAVAFSNKKKNNKLMSFWKVKEIFSWLTKPSLE